MKVFPLMMLLAALTSCSKTPDVSKDPNSKIGVIDQMGVKVSVDTPIAEPCQRKYSSVKRDTFEQCMVTDMTYVQVANVFGSKGTLQASSGSSEIWHWAGREGSAMIGFNGGKMVSKSQSGLE